jgi:hypothetical protein
MPLDEPPQEPDFDAATSSPLNWSYTSGGQSSTSEMSCAGTKGAGGTSKPRQKKPPDPAAEHH